MVTKKDLRFMYRKANERFFDGKLPESITIRFAKELESEHVDGEFITPDTILIAHYLRPSHTATQLVLLHEMVHLELGDAYKGYPADGGHGMRFQARLVELFNAGAYDGAL